MKRGTTYMLIVENRSGAENREQPFAINSNLPQEDMNVQTDLSSEPRDKGRTESVANSHIVEGNRAITSICGQYGMAGVSRTTSMIALEHDQDVQRCFPHGVLSVAKLIESLKILSVSAMSNDMEQNVQGLGM